MGWRNGLSWAVDCDAKGIVCGIMESGSHDKREHSWTQCRAFGIALLDVPPMIVEVVVTPTSITGVSLNSRTPGVSTNSRVAILPAP